MFGDHQASVLYSVCFAGAIEISIFHPVDTIAKRLQVHQGSVSFSNVSDVIYRGQTPSTFQNKVSSLFTGVCTHLFLHLSTWKRRCCCHYSSLLSSFFFFFLWLVGVFPQEFDLLLSTKSVKGAFNMVGSRLSQTGCQVRRCRAEFAKRSVGALSSASRY